LGFFIFCDSTASAFDSGFAIAFVLLVALLAGFEVTLEVAFVRGLTLGLAVAGVFLAAGLLAAFWVGRRTRFLAAGATVVGLVAGVAVSEEWGNVFSVDIFKMGRS
jgi:hypothetical protein